MTKTHGTTSRTNQGGMLAKTPSNTRKGSSNSAKHRRMKDDTVGQHTEAATNVSCVLQECIKGRPHMRSLEGGLPKLWHIANLRMS